MKSKEFLDEQIIDMINEVEQEEIIEATIDNGAIKPEERTIYTGIKVKNEWIYFEPRFFLDEKIKMMVPEHFDEMSPEMARTKYPSEDRPEIILTDETTAVNLMISHLPEAMSDDEAKMMRDQMIGMMMRLNPGIKPLSTGDEILCEKTVAYVEFSNPVLDGKLYNLLCFMELENRTFMLSFNCLTKESKYWKKHAFEMMQSIEIMEENDNESTINE